jgi:LmbE family N-acetylglucosaminyl deacetylase
MYGCAVVAEWVFVSPHLDDVALSCGGAVAKAARSGAPLIVTVFAGIPEGDLSEFAHFQHERWNLPDSEGVVLRREEDRRAARELGESVQIAWLDYLDAIYRDPDYSSDEALFGAPLECDLTLAEQVYQDLRRLPTTRYVLPMGIGNHVDHQIVREAGAMLLRDGSEVWVYAEVPYVIHDGTIALVIGQLSAGEPVNIRLDDDALRRKCAAALAYESQVPVLFRDLGEPCEELEAFARQQGGGTPAELLWRLRPEDDPLLRRRPFVA